MRLKSVRQVMIEHILKAYADKKNELLKRTLPIKLIKWKSLC